MSDPVAFQQLVHADWSSRPEGRWAAKAARHGDDWLANTPFKVPALGQYVDDLFGLADRGPTLAGFDFPLGLPVAYGSKTGFGDFISALSAFGSGDWANFYDVAEFAVDVSPKRPFYPQRPGAALRRHLLTGHGFTSIDALTRRCERGGAGQKAAGCLFWTLGGNQVGKAMLAGWKDVVVPARLRGARLWPFDGSIATLAARGGLTIVETYPADVYGTLGAAFRPRESKRRQADRASKANALLHWAERSRVELDPGLRAAIVDGFGAIDRGGDRFDAVVGLFGMIAVVTGRRASKVPDSDDVRRWEGWILGRQG